MLEHRAVPRTLDRAPVAVRQRYQKWKDIVAASGPQGLRRIRGYRDEALVGQWFGYRSSRLGAQYRVIYRVQADVTEVVVVAVNAHDYRRR